RRRPLSPSWARPGSLRLRSCSLSPSYGIALKHSLWPTVLPALHAGYWLLSWWALPALHAGYWLLTTGYSSQHHPPLPLPQPLGLRAIESWHPPTIVCSFVQYKRPARNVAAKELRCLVGAKRAERACAGRRISRPGTPCGLRAGQPRRNLMLAHVAEDRDIG